MNQLRYLLSVILALLLILFMPVANAITLGQNANEMVLSVNADKTTIDPGDWVTFYVGVMNAGTSNIINIDVMEGISFVGGKTTDIAPGLSDQVEIGMAIDQTCTKEFTVTTMFADGHYAQNLTAKLSITVVQPPAPPDIELKMTSDKDTVPVGNTIKFNTQVKNIGSTKIKHLEFQEIEQKTNQSINVTIIPGGIADIEIVLTITQVCDVAFDVTATFEDGQLVTRTTNMIPINTSASSGRAWDTQDNSDIEWGKDGGEVTQEDSSTAEESNENAQLEPLDESNTDVLNLNDQQEQLIQTNFQEINPKQKQDNTLMTILYVLLGLSFVGAGVLVTLLVNKLKNRKLRSRDI